MRMDLRMTNKKGEVVSNGKLEIKNQSERSADLFIYGDIISDSWYKCCNEETCPQDIVEFLTGLEGAENINIYINSGGGSVWAGIAIYQQLKRHTAKKTVYIDGIAASIASIIAMAADELIMPEGAELMIHKPMNGYIFEMRNADELRKDADVLDRAQENITDIYMTMAADGVTRETITAAINNETWMNTTKAHEYFNLNVEESRIAAAACNSAYFTRYQNTPCQLKDEKAQAVNVQLHVDASEVADKVTEKLVDALKDNEKRELLADLGQFGA